MASVAEQLRRAILAAEKRGMTRYAIAKASGVSQAQLSKLMREQRSPRLDTAEKIVRALGKRLTITDPE